MIQVEMSFIIYRPPTRYTPFSFAALERTSVDWPGMVSAYSGKYDVP
jgi:hypothetical protein